MVMVVGACGWGCSSPVAPTPLSRAVPSARPEIGAGPTDFAGCFAGSHAPSCYSETVTSKPLSASIVGPPSISLNAAVNGDVVLLSWAPPTGSTAGNFQLVAGSAPGLEDLAQLIVQGSSFSTIAPAGTYYVTVYSLASGTPVRAAWSNEVKVVVGTAAPHGCPQPPINAHLNRPQVVGQTVSLSWSAASTDVTRFILKVTSGSALLGSFPFSATTTSYVQNSVAYGVYSATIAAEGPCGTGPDSSPISIRVVPGTLTTNDQMLPEDILDRLAVCLITVYPQLKARFNPAAPAEVHVQINTNVNNPGEALGNQIRMSSTHMRTNPWDTDVLTHELMHVVQGYTSNVPDWVVEGLADYARHKYGLANGQGGWSLPGYMPGQNYTDSYHVTAGFFVWLEHIRGLSSLMNDLDATARAGQYSDSFWSRTGSNLTELWDAYAGRALGDYTGYWIWTACPAGWGCSYTARHQVTRFSLLQSGGVVSGTAQFQEPTILSGSFASGMLTLRVSYPNRGNSLYSTCDLRLNGGQLTGGCRQFFNGGVGEWDLFLSSR